MHYLTAIWDGGGTVPVELGVVRRLIDRGHTVTVLADPSVREDVQATGAAYRPWTRAPHRLSPAVEDDLVRDWEVKSPLAKFRRVRDRLVMGPAGAFAADVRQALEEEPADAVLADFALFGAMLGAESKGVPTAVLVPNVYPRRAPGLPPFGLGMSPAAGPLGRLRDSALGAVTTRLWDGGLPALNGARAELGLAPLDDPFDQWDLADRVLVLTSQAFDLPGRLPGNVRYTGAVLDDPVWTAPYVTPAGDEPLVVVGLSSTYQDQGEALRRVVAALGTLPVRGVVTTGPAVDPASVPGTPRVHVVRSAPHRQLFAEAAVVVTHAGHGTLLKALAAGVPALCLPMGRDQADNVVRAARHRAAIGLRPTASSRAVARAVRTLLHDPSYTQGARRIGEQVRRDAASSVLVDELEALARSGSRTVR